MRNNSKSYHSIDENATSRRESTPWYWRLIALASSWMILGGYLILPGLYTKDYKLKISEAVLSVFVVAFLTAGYSFTALLCFACRNEMFQAEGVFLPALTSSAVGLLIVAYNLGVSNGFYWGNAAISGTVVSAIATVLYGSLLLWTHHRIVKKRQKASSRAANLWSEQSYYSNYVQNMYPTATPSPSHPAEPTLSEDERVNQQMALLLMKSDARPSPDANSATFRIDLPGQREEEERQARSQELIGSPGQPNPDWNRSRADSRPDSLSEQQAWEQSTRGRSADRPSGNSTRSAHTRNLSREERRREIELGRV